MNCGIDSRPSSGLALLYLWCRPARGYSSDLTPSLGISICCRCGPKKAKKKNKKVENGHFILCLRIKRRHLSLGIFFQAWREELCFLNILFHRIGEKKEAGWKQKKKLFCRSLFLYSHDFSPFFGK